MCQCDNVRRRNSSAGSGASATGNYCSCGHWRFHFGRSNRLRPRRHFAALPVNEIKNQRFRADLDRASGAELDRKETCAAFWKRRRRDRRLRISADGRRARYLAENDWKSNEYDDKSRGERDDAYIKLAFRNADDVLDEEWEKISLLVFKPIF